MNFKIKLTEGKIVDSDTFCLAWTKSLKDFGYTELSTKDVKTQLIKILKQEKDISVIGRFIVDEIDIQESNSLNITTISMNGFSFLYDCKEGTITEYEFQKEDENFMYYKAIREEEKTIIKVYIDDYDFK